MDAYSVAEGERDWSPYSRVEEAAAVYLRDADLALESLRGVVDLRAVQAFTLERTFRQKDWGESSFQEVAITDGRRLILWIGEDIVDEDDESGIALLESTIRSLPLSAIVDRSLDTRYRTSSDGARSLHSVELRLCTMIPDSAAAKSPADTDIYREQFTFTKSVTNGGRAQMERLAQFGRVVSGHG